MWVFWLLKSGLTQRSWRHKKHQGGPESERPRSLLLSLGGAIQTLAWVLSWACPGPIPGPRWSRPDSPCALFYSVWDPSRSRGGGPSRPVLVPSCSRAFLPGSGLDGQKQTSWPLPTEPQGPCHTKKDAAFLHTVVSFPLTVELFNLQLTILAFYLQLELSCL